MGNARSKKTGFDAFKSGCLALSKKRIKRRWCLFAFYLLAVSMRLKAEQSGDFTYNVVSSSECTITGYSGAGGNLDIPPSFTDGSRTFIVYGIADRAFKACTNLTGVTIPGSVTAIGYEAFRGCSRLTSVIIPARVTEISGYTFTACSNLTSVTISAQRPQSIESGAFSDCASLSAVYFLGHRPSSVYGAIFTGSTNAIVYYQPQKIGWTSTFASRPTALLPFKYGVTVDGKASFCGFGSSAAGDVTVPAEAGGYPVTDIGGQAFYGCVGMTRVTIPTNITSIGSGAFFGCKGLTTVTIPDSVTNIERYAFSECSGLRRVTIGSSVTSIATRAFSGCHALTGVSIPPSVGSIGDQAFESCSGVNAITGLSGVTRIGSGAFSDCRGLSGMAIPDSVTNIGWWAFSDCAGLTEVSVPGSVTLIGDYAFSGCSDIKEITVAVDNANYSSFDGVLFNKAQTALIRCPGGMTGNYTVPSDVVVIENEAFSGCAGLNVVAIPSGVDSIGEYVFEDCTALTSIDVDPACAKYCSMDGVLFDGPMTTLIHYPASKAQNSYAVPSGVTSIGPCAFKECAVLTEVELPASVTSIGDHAFFNCAALTSINVDPANANYSSVDGVLFGYGLWGQPALIQCPGGKIGDYAIPGSIQSIEDCAFYNCTGLTGVSIPSAVAEFGDYAFFNCTGLTNITISGSQISVGNFTFANCSSLDSIAISSSYCSIGDSAFLNCSGATGIDVAGGSYLSLDGVLYDCNGTRLIQFPGGKTGPFTVPSSVTCIKDLAFFNCAGLTAIDVQPDNEVYSSNGGVLFDKYQTTLIQCPGGITGSCCLPPSVTSVGECAFFNCATLQEISVDESNTNYKSLDGVLFNRDMDCLIQYPGGKTGSSYTVSDAVSCIGDGAFSGAAGLTGVYFKGDKPCSVGLGVFSGSDYLTVYYMPGTMGWGDPLFAGRPAVLLPYLYTATDAGISLSAYVGTNAVEIIPSFIEGKPVTDIDSYAFFNCTGLTSVTIPAGVTNIGNSAFENCTALTGIRIPLGVLHIGDAAFFNCAGLTGVTLPGSITSIGDWTFASCNVLTVLSIPANVTHIGNYAFGYCANLAGVYFKGDAPDFGWAAFNGSGDAVIYYLPGTAGWDQPIAGHVPVLWNPRVQSGPGFGHNEGGLFGFTVLGTNDMAVAVEACTNLANAVWSPVSTLTLFNGEADFTDVAPTGHSARYYRFRMP